MEDFKVKPVIKHEMFLLSTTKFYSQTRLVLSAEQN